MNPRDFLSQAAGKPIRTKQGYWAFVPNPLPQKIEIGNELVKFLGEADRAMGELKGLSGAISDPALFINPILRLEAVISSRIEGTRASLEDLFIYEGTQLSFFETAGDVREVHNYILALEYGIQRINTLPVSNRLIKELHAILLNNARGDFWSPGEFRTKQNWIGFPGSTLETASFVPPPQVEMLVCLGDLEKFIHQPSNLPALVRLGMIHCQFEAIHPFADGNGRIGRLLNSLITLDWKLQPQPLFHISPYFESHRQEYYARLLAVSQKGDWAGWLGFFLQGVRDTCFNTVTRIQNLQAVHRDYLGRVKSERNAARLANALTLIFSKPIISTGELSKSLEIPYKSAQRIIGSLTRLSILREITDRARNRLFQADDIINSIK
ncbi:MAG: Fic family protein [Pelolinea sp.]|nr:Fic family protein [Pelolinea sp.]